MDRDHCLWFSLFRNLAVIAVWETKCSLILQMFVYIVKLMPFALDVMDILSPHYFELDFPNTEAASCAGNSSALLVFLQHLYAIYVWIRQAAVILKLPLWGTSSLLQTMLYRKEHLLSYQPTVHFMHLLGSDTIKNKH